MNTATILLAFCALAVASALGGGMPDKVRAEFEKCVESTGANPELLHKKFKGEDVAVNDEMKCFAACMLKSHKMMKEDGTVDAELGKANVPSDMPNRDAVLAAIDACANEKGANECETGHAITVCMHKNLKGHMPEME